MPSFASLGKFFGRTASEGAAFAAGLAVAPTLEPELQDLLNASWALHPSKAVDAETAAAIVAEDVQKEPWGQQEAAYHGFNPERFAAMLGEVLNAPGLPELLTLWRRNEITDADFLHGLRKAKLEGRWDAPLEALKTERLDPAVIATAIQRGIMVDPGFLPVGPPAGQGNVKAFPVSTLDTINEAASSGIDADRLFVETAIVGLPLSLFEAAAGYFRGILTIDDFKRAVSEGNTRNEWGDAALAVARQIITAHDGIEARLRGWIDDTEMYAQTARHGMSQEDTDLLFKITGRPLSFHQAFIGARRGGELDGSIADIPEYFLKALRESNIRPEWYALAWAQRFTYPSTFVLRALTEAGDLTADETNTILLYEGWEPKLADKVSKRWAATVAGTKTNKQVASAQTKLITATHKAYIGGVLDDAGAGAVLGVAGLTPEVTKEVLYFWAEEKQVDNLPGPAAPPVVA